MLNENDYKEMAAQISEGHNSVEYLKDGVMIAVDCDFETEGSWEDDYYNGTGYYAEFARNLRINKVDACDELGKKVCCKIDREKLESLVE